METERQLLEAINNGERAALHRLYDRYSDYAMGVALRYIPQHEVARDVLQDSFVKILTSIDKFNYRGEGTLKSWVCRIVANSAIDYLRQQEHFMMVDSIPDEPEEETDMEEVPPDVLLEMIGRLPTNYRVVLNLYVFEHSSHREIGLQLGIKESTSSSIFFRARKMLKTMIWEYLKEQET